ncbi:MAG: hypothetical protein HZY79_07450 [Rhodoblastus sp.]|nr:MAG: hypothetical protein HZY79_07450 [Rhodoblastus sp.]
MTAGAGYGVSQYVDLGGVFGAAGSVQAPVAPQRTAQGPAAAQTSLFDPRLSLGVGAGFVATPRQDAGAEAARSRPSVTATAAPKPTPLPDEAAEIAIPTPVARPPTAEVAAVAPEAFTPIPPRRPSDLSFAAPAPRAAARPASPDVASAPSAAQTATAAAAAQASASVGRPPRRAWKPPTIWSG